MGIFAAQKSNLFQTYRGQLTFRSKIMGPTPKDPKMIQAWIRKSMGIENQEEIARMMVQTLLELGVDVPPDAPLEELAKASEKVANTRQCNGFKTGTNGLYLESRALKACLKECVNILYAGKEKWGVTRKGPKPFFAERVFVNPDELWLGTKEPHGILPFTGHVMTPKGPQSNLQQVEYVERATLTFEIIVLHDEITPDQWPDIWNIAEEIGLGAMRSQGFGRFDILAWDKDSKGLAVAAD